MPSLTRRLAQVLTRTPSSDSRETWVAVLQSVSYAWYSYQKNLEREGLMAVDVVEAWRVLSSPIKVSVPFIRELAMRRFGTYGPGVFCALSGCITGRAQMKERGIYGRGD